MPVAEGTYAVAITPQSIAFTNGQRASLYGKAGHHYAWHDPPSFAYVSKLLLTQQHRLTTDGLVELIRLVVRTHPAVVNARDPQRGASLVQLAVEASCHARILDTLLRVDCRVGLLPNTRGLTALDSALQRGDATALRALLSALLTGRFSPTPAGMRLVTDAFEALASKAPHEFLWRVASAPHEPPHPHAFGARARSGLPRRSVHRSSDCIVSVRACCISAASRLHLGCISGAAGSSRRCRCSRSPRSLTRRRRTCGCRTRARTSSAATSRAARWACGRRCAARATRPMLELADVPPARSAPPTRIVRTCARAAQVLAKYRNMFEAELFQFELTSAQRRRASIGTDVHGHAHGHAPFAPIGATLRRAASFRGALPGAKPRQPPRESSGSSIRSTDPPSAAADTGDGSSHGENSFEGVGGEGSFDSGASGDPPAATPLRRSASDKSTSRRGLGSSSGEPSTPSPSRHSNVSSAASGAPAASNGDKPKPRTGFVRVQSGGLQALRIPFEYFAGFPDGTWSAAGDGAAPAAASRGGRGAGRGAGKERKEKSSRHDPLKARPSPLELIVRAVNTTRSYEVFDSLPLKILLTCTPRAPRAAAPADPGACGRARVRPRELLRGARGAGTSGWASRVASSTTSSSSSSCTSCAPSSSSPSPPPSTASGSR